MRIFVGKQLINEEEFVFEQNYFIMIQRAQRLDLQICQREKILCGPV